MDTLLLHQLALMFVLCLNTFCLTQAETWVSVRVTIFAILCTISAILFNFWMILVTILPSELLAEYWPF